MNIFEVLSRGNGSVNEENVSAFLAYLLDPNETHGLSGVFLEAFVGLLGLSNGESELICSADSLKIKLEWTDEGQRYIDIVLEAECADEKIIIAIENKIQHSSFRNEQLKNQYEKNS